MSEPKRPIDVALSVLNGDPRSWGARVGTALLRLQNRLERRSAAVLAAHGLTLPQFDVLATLSHGEGITQQELAERLLVTKGNVVGIIDRAAAAGWVERRPDPDDRRVNRLYLTDAGHALLARAAPCQLADTERTFRALTEGELRLLHEWVVRLDAATSRDP